jgi:hypothetical protein
MSAKAYPGIGLALCRVATLSWRTREGSASMEKKTNEENKQIKAPTVEKPAKTRPVFIELTDSEFETVSGGLMLYRCPRT